MTMVTFKGNGFPVHAGEPPNNVWWKAYLAGEGSRTDRIGEEIEFIRYGDLPENGKSRVWRTFAKPYTAYPELAGVSVFEVVDGEPQGKLRYPDEFYERPVYRGRGRIVGWGTDSEPLVEVIEIARSDYKRASIMSPIPGPRSGKPG